MGEQLLGLHPVDQHGQPVRLAVQVGRVDLVDVSGEDDLRVLAGPGDDRLDLVRREVLGLIHYEEHVCQRSAADVGERRDAELLALDHLGQRSQLAAVSGQPVADHRKVVPQRLHVRVQLALHVPGEVAQVSIPERHDGTREIDLAKITTLLERSGERQQRLAGSGSARERYQAGLATLQCIESEDLFGVARLDAVGGAFDDALQRPVGLIVMDEGAQAAVAHDQVLVRPQRSRQRCLGDGKGVRRGVEA